MKILSGVAGVFGLKLAGASLGFMNGVLLARLLGPEEFGVYSLLLAAVNFVTVVVLLGLPTITTREVAASAERGQWNQVRNLVRLTHFWTLLAVVMLVALLAPLLAAGSLGSGVTWTLAIASIALLVLNAFSQLRAAILRGLHWVVLADTPELLLRPVLVLVLLGIVIPLTESATAVHALSIQLCGSALAFAVGAWWLVEKLPKLMKRASPASTHRTLLLGSWPFLVISVVNTLEPQVSLYLLGYLAGAEAAGLFQAAIQLVGLIAIGLISVNMPLQPRLAAAWARNNTQLVQRLLTDAARLGTGIAVAGGLAILIFAEGVLSLYGPQYVGAAVALRVLAVGQILNAAAGSCGILVMMTGHQKAALHGTSLALLVNLAVAYVAVPRLGIVGGALATVVSLCFWNLYLVIYARHRLNLNTTVLSTR